MISSYSLKLVHNEKFYIVAFSHDLWLSSKKASDGEAFRAFSDNKPPTVAHVAWDCHHCPGYQLVREVTWCVFELLTLKADIRIKKVLFNNKYLLQCIHLYWLALCGGQAEPLERI